MSNSDYITVFSIVLGLFSVVLGGWIKTGNKIVRLEAEIEFLQNRHEDFSDTLNKIYDCLDEIKDTLHKKVDR